MSGREPYRYVCSDCGQNFMAVMKLVPVASNQESPQLPGESVAGSGEGTS